MKNLALDLESARKFEPDSKFWTQNVKVWWRWGGAHETFTVTELHKALTMRGRKTTTSAKSIAFIPGVESHWLSRNRPPIDNNRQGSSQISSLNENLCTLTTLLILNRFSKTQLLSDSIFQGLHSDIWFGWLSNKTVRARGEKLNIIRIFEHTLHKSQPILIKLVSFARELNSASNDTWFYGIV